MHNNMVKLMQLPGRHQSLLRAWSTPVTNLNFALSLEPDNVETPGKAAAGPKRGGPTTSRPLPARSARIKAINPFVRVDSSELQAHVQQSFPGLSLDPVSVLEKTRYLKDNF